MNIKRIIGLGLTGLVFLSLSCGSAFAEVRHENKYEHKELTPDERLILAVKGTKIGTAILVGLFNPLAGVVIASLPNEECSSDLAHIDSALAKGAYINAKEEHSGYTALIYAAYYGYPEITKHLLAKGADVSIKEDKGYNAYTMAQYYVDSYQGSLVRNEQRPYEKDFDAQKQADMREYYSNLITRYQAVVNILEPLTADRKMPKSFWF